MKESMPFENVKREIFVRKETKTSSEFGCQPEKASVDELLKYGIVNINKPRGPTSHQVSAYVQQILGINKSGHSGTLDPNVTGVLPVALGRSTRIVQNLLTAGKEYIGIMRLHKKLEDENIKKVMSGFVGKIKQLPPIKSAIKREWRYREIYYLNVLEISEKEVLFKVGCQAGTYIRKLCHDIGVSLKCGAHMSELIRTKAGPFSYENTITLQDLRDAIYYYKKDGKEKFIRKCINPVESGVAHLPKVWVMDTSVDSLCHGANLAVPGISKVNSGIKKEDITAIMTLKDELICIGKAKIDSKEMLKEKGLAVNSEKVFMLPNTYPKIKREKKE